MGCDIHLHIEIKYKGRWRNYSAPMVGRSYALFAKMANVRNYGSIDPLSEPRGLPEECDEITLFHYRMNEPDAHSESWLGSKELAELMEWWRALPKEDHEDYFDPLGYVFGNGVEAWVKYPTDCKHLKAEGMEDIRAVFWFDN